MWPSRLRCSVLLAASALALAACGGDDDSSDSSAASSSTSSSASSPASSSAPSSTTDAAPTGTPGAQLPAGYPPRPERDQCVVLPEAPDGTYTVYEAGTAVVTRDGDRLVLGEITAADGWTSRVDDQEADEVEIDFRADGSTALDLEVEIDDGRLEVQICADDD